MSDETAAASVAASEGGEGHAGHEHHWEVSWAPLATVAGIVFLIPLTFASWFVYESTLLAVAFAGIGTPLLLAGISKWVAEGMSQKALVPGVAAIGLPIFIISEVLIFLSLFASYWMMRLGADTWPPEGSAEMPVLLPLVMTALLVSSSVTIHVAEVKMDRKDIAGFRTWLYVTIALGILFLGCTTYEYSHLVSIDFVPSTNAFSTAFFSITGFHASHVLVGLGIFIAVAIPALAGRIDKTFVTCASIYWHFVDVVWFFVVSQIYFW